MNADQPNRCKSLAAQEANLPSSLGEKVGRVKDVLGVGQGVDDMVLDDDGVA
jgi:hypothetical protein